MSAPSTYEGHTYVLLYEGVRLNKEAEENKGNIHHRWNLDKTSSCSSLQALALELKS